MAGGPCDETGEALEVGPEGPAAINSVDGDPVPPAFMHPASSTAFLEALDRAAFNYVPSSFNLPERLEGMIGW